jgi:hypothetical protein
MEKERGRLQRMQGYKVEGDQRSAHCATEIKLKPPSSVRIEAQMSAV